MKKRILSFILLSTMLVSLLAGCGSKETSNSDVPNTEVTENMTTSESVEDTVLETEIVTEETQSTEIVEETETQQEQTEESEQPSVTYTYEDMSVTMYAKQSVNVRSLPSTDGEKLGSLSYAQEVAVTGKCNETGWYRIDFNGSVGYVSNNYLVSEKPAEQTETPSEPTEPSQPSGRYGGYWDVEGSGTYTGATVYTNPTYGTSFTIPTGTTVWGNDRPEIYNSTYPILLAKANNFSGFGITLCFGRGSTLTESIDIEKKSNTSPAWTCGETYTSTIGGNTYHCFNVVHSDGSQDTIYLFRESGGKILMYEATASAVQYISY